MKSSRRIVITVLLAAFVTSTCGNNESAPGRQGATDPAPTSTATAPAEPTAEAGPSERTSSPQVKRLCDTKIESASPVLRDVRFGRHDTYDRLAFDFCKPADTTITTAVVKQLTEDGSGDKVTLRGTHFLTITLTPADAHSDDGRPTVPDDAVTVAGRYMQQYKLIGDFEGVVTYGVGLKSLAETATAMRADPDDPRHIIFSFDIGPQHG